MDRAAVRAEFDNQIRRNPAAERGALVEREPRVTRIISGGDGWSGVLWSDLTEADADAVIGTQVSRFAELGRPWEWKYYSYDQPAGLPGRLEAAGFAPGPAETLLVAQIADLDADVSAPPGVELVPVTDASGVAAVVGVHDEVFGGEHAAIGSAIMAALASRPRPVEAVAAVAEGRAVSAGRVEFPAGSDFASLWGGGTLPGWRGRGVFRSLVAYRARLARDRGFRYLQVDASADSSPILQRLGFAELARTTPFVYPGYQGDVVPVRHVHGLAVSAADTLNQVFPLASLRQADRPADADHPFGHGQERYFWPLLAALGIFIAGAGEAWSCR